VIWSARPRLKLHGICAAERAAACAATGLATLPLGHPDQPTVTWPNKRTTNSQSGLIAHLAPHEVDPAVEYIALRQLRWILAQALSAIAGQSALGIGRRGRVVNVGRGQCHANHDCSNSNCAKQRDLLAEDEPRAEGDRHIHDCRD
jgi:hypothetical protein